MIAGNVPKHLVSTARTGFLLAVEEADREFPWRRVAMVHNMSEASEDQVDLGATPMPKNSSGGVTIQDHIEITQTVEPTDWDVTVWISENAIQDDQTGMLEQRVRGAGRRFNQHINKRVFVVLNGGDSAKYGPAYDGQHFFDNDHVDDGAEYQTNQDNEGTTNLSFSAFNSAWTNAMQFRDDQGEFTEFNYDQLIVHPTNKQLANEITQSTERPDTADRTINSFAGELRQPIVTPHLDTNAAILTASSEPIKPLILAMRRDPELQHAWFDPTAPDGGRHYFKFYARYAVHYGNWRLAYQIQT